MRLRDALLALILPLAPAFAAAEAADGNRLTYLDGCDPYYVGLGFPKLVTPQWVGEEGVEAVVVLAIDDMKESGKYETFLRPILDRLKLIDGRAPLSIMTCQADPADPRLQSWLKEGVSIEAHTLSHPCPLLQKGDFDSAARTYHGCVDLLNRIPHNRPVAFRMPCCDSRNTLSPRFFAEIFNKTSPDQHFLTIDSSVFHLFTPADPSLPRSLVEDADGGERFRKYLPFPSFVNTIENYPYPYVVNRLCWEFPCMVPSDWEAQNLQKPNNPRTVEDLKAALDAVVLKQGVFNLVFHPHGWIKAEQVVELIDHAVRAHGPKVKFLNFREVQERLDQNMLGGQPLRAKNGSDNGLRVLDLDNDGFMDVVIGNSKNLGTRLWDAATNRWKLGELPMNSTIEMRHRADLRALFAALGSGRFWHLGVVGYPHDLGIRFGTFGHDAETLMVMNSEWGEGAWLFHDGKWLKAGDGGFLPRTKGIALENILVWTNRGVQLRDLNHDGTSELIVGNKRQNGIFSWKFAEKRWEKLPFALPGWARVYRGGGGDAGLRFLDLDEDGYDDIVSSNDLGYGSHLFEPNSPGLRREAFGLDLIPAADPDHPRFGGEEFGKGWTRTVASGSPGDAGALPKIVRDGKNNGFWAHSRHLWWQNEETANLPDLVDRRSFNHLLKDVEPRARSPEASRRSIRVRPGFAVELMAAEPLVKDPIAFDWGADGKLWVVEMGDYPLGTDGKGKPGGIVRYLEDSDGDGRYDMASTFLDGLGFPTGVIPWREGVIVACAPDIFYAEDRDGDGRADHREVLFTGFFEGNQQHRVNGFDLGLDGWIYGANGDSGGVIRSLKTGATVDIGRRDFRFRPDDGRFEAESGMTQYGRHRDDFGRWFGNNNPTWAWHFVLADADLRRNPHVAPPDTRQVLEPDTALFPISRPLPRFNTPGASGRVTSANSPTPYRDDLFGPHFEGSLFVSEPVHNLVHRMVLEPDGATVRGHRAPGEADREFLASTDHWTRPTMLRTGPDGCLWVADMYRAVIEHPEWIPDDWEARLDLRAGSEEGRIYRVRPVDRAPRPIPRLDRLDVPGLVAALDSPGGWQRDTAQRLLVHRRDPAAIGPLLDLASRSERPKTRIQALWTLHNLDALTPDAVASALKDQHPQVRRNAAKAGEGLLGGGHPALADAYLGLADDPDAAVRLQAALSFGTWDDRRAGRALARIARRDAADPWLRAAVLGSATSHVDTILASLFADSPHEPPPASLIEPLFVLAGTIQDRRCLTELVRTLGTPAKPDERYAGWQFSALAGLLDASERARRPLSPDEERDLAGLRGASRTVARDDGAGDDDRVAAVRLLGRDPSRRDEDRDLLAGLLRPRVSVRVQMAAVQALGRTHDPKVPAALLNGWRGHSPSVRGVVLDVLLSRDEWAGALLSSLEDTCTPAAEIDPTHRRLLLGHRDPDLKARAEAVFDEGGGGRQAVVEAYRPALTLRGDPQAGAIAFKKSCASCHRFGGDGIEVGPDIAALADKSPAALLIAILDPNRAYEARFADFTVHTTDGRVLNGLIAAETATSVTLRRQDRKEDVLLRAEIESMAGSGRSLMPEGLENDLKPRDVADLIAFLRGKGTGGAP